MFAREATHVGRGHVCGKRTTLDLLVCDRLPFRLSASVAIRGAAVAATRNQDEHVFADIFSVAMVASCTFGLSRFSA